MDSVVSSRFRHTSLPHVSISKELSRRDSLSSSRTRDSGYNSDLDISLSPFEYVDPQKHISLVRIPSLQLSHMTGNAYRVDTVSSLQNDLSRTLVMPHLSSSLVEEPRSVPAIKGPSTTLEEADDDIEEWIRDNLPSHNRPEQRVSSIVSLSSATSYEMYTDTDMSDDEHHITSSAPRCTLPGPTVKTINLIMRKVESHSRGVALQCNGGNASTAASGNESSTQRGTRRVSQDSGKRKTRYDEEPYHNDDGEGDKEIPNKRRRGSLATIGSSERGAKFACPFYKHEPHRFRARRTCPGPGWPTVHRMKEHLYRAHAQLVYCPRCYATFDADMDLSSHLRSAHCLVSEPQSIEGIDRETLKSLRKRSPVFRPEEDKWRDVYHVLFPDVDLEDIPSPFYDADTPSEESRRFRRELLRRVQQELLSTAGQLPHPVEHQLLHQVANIVRRCEEELLNPLTRTSLDAPPLSSRRASDTSTLSSWSQHTPYHSNSIHFDLDNPRSLQQPVQSSTHVDGFAWLEESNHRQAATEQSGPFAPVVWEQLHALDTITEWNDSEALSLPPKDVCGDDVLAHFPTGMGTW
ncbi:hypothetical protein HBI42_126390 [Parastagonospora nodorum]|nr:hypothetical protein HBI43_121400 [Parastagonospora nodorum]KAH6255452.1 hypothetical protein HBI42_126390 [Parastagonospora nodorum]